MKMSPSKKKEVITNRLNQLNEYLEERGTGYRYKWTRHGGRYHLSRVNPDGRPINDVRAFQNLDTLYEVVYVMTDAIYLFGYESG